MSKNRSTKTQLDSNEMRADTCVANSRESDISRFARLQKQQCMSPFSDRAKDRVRAVETEREKGEPAPAEA